jgi:hypothetical protein
MYLLQIFAGLGVAYCLGIAGFGVFMTSLLNGEDVTDEAGNPIPLKYFVITALVWPYSIYLLLNGKESDGTP